MIDIEAQPAPALPIAPAGPAIIELRVEPPRKGEEAPWAFTVDRITSGEREAVWRGSERDQAMEAVAAEIADGALLLDLTREREIPANAALHRPQRFEV